LFGYLGSNWRFTGPVVDCTRPLHRIYLVGSELVVFGRRKMSFGDSAGHWGLGLIVKSTVASAWGWSGLGAMVVP